MKKILLTLLSVATLSSGVATLAHAANSTAFAAITSNYVFRGFTQTNDDPAVQGGYNIQQSKDDKGWYAGVFASTFSKGIEVDGFGGWKGSLGKQSSYGYDVGAIVYQYTESTFTDVTEFYAGISYETAYAKLYIGNGSGIKSYNYIDLGAAFIVMEDIDLNVHFGNNTETSINDVSAALSTQVKDFDFSLGASFEDATDEFEFFVTVGKEFDL
ncbi:MAG: TorF family putative porin [Woeseiaceae bacterium]